MTYVTKACTRPCTNQVQRFCDSQSWLRTAGRRCAPGRDRRRAHPSGHQRRPRFQQPMLTIHQRPFVPKDRSEAGNWEGNLTVGKDQGSAIGTLVERQTRLVRLLHLPRRDGESLHQALKSSEYPPRSPQQVRLAHKRRRLAPRESAGCVVDDAPPSIQCLVRAKKPTIGKNCECTK